MVVGWGFIRFSIACLGISGRWRTSAKGGQANLANLMFVELAGLEPFFTVHFAKASRARKAMVGRGYGEVRRGACLVGEAI